LWISEGGILESNAGFKVRDSEGARVGVKVEVEVTGCLELVLFRNNNELSLLTFSAWGAFLLLVGTL